MPDEETQTTEETEFAAWLEELDDGEAEEVADEETEAERQDEKALKVAQQTQKVVSEFISEQKTEDMVDKFKSEAPQGAQDLFAIYRTGDENPKQLKRIMQLAITKDAETQNVEVETTEEAETEAAKIAREQYGVGPISGGESSPSLTPEQRQYNEMVERVQKTGDPNALLVLMAEDSPFIDAVLTGKDLRK